MSRRVRWFHRSVRTRRKAGADTFVSSRSGVWVMTPWVHTVKRPVPPHASSRTLRAPLQSAQGA
ncbi:hypothetical protein ACFU3O_22870 [Streptomyces antibioticus]|uniref:hypothetical protein n=1 Tax=Streptomyces antibioticus TaxID=1890 RepID=UPI0036CD392E